MMMDNLIIEKMNQILDENGIYLNEDVSSDIEVDSLTYMSIIVGIEDMFKISIPVKYLSTDMPSSILGFYDFVNRILQDADTISTEQNI